MVGPDRMSGTYTAARNGGHGGSQRTTNTSGSNAQRTEVDEVVEVAEVAEGARRLHAPLLAEARILGLVDDDEGAVAGAPRLDVVARPLVVHVERDLRHRGLVSGGARRGAGAGQRTMRSKMSEKILCQLCTSGHSVFRYSSEGDSASNPNRSRRNSFRKSIVMPNSHVSNGDLVRPSAKLMAMTTWRNTVAATVTHAVRTKPRHWGRRTGRARVAHRTWAPACRGRSRWTRGSGTPGEASLTAAGRPPPRRRWIPTTLLASCCTSGVSVRHVSIMRSTSQLVNVQRTSTRCAPATPVGGTPQRR